MQTGNGLSHVGRIATAMLLAASLAPASCSRDDALAWPERTAERILLVTFDTTRADRIGAYGRKPSSTPNLDRLAEEGVVFEKAVAPAPTTLPSHASLMTGASPPDHGARDNGFELSDGRATLAEVFRTAGWRTGASVGSYVLDERFGIARGFESYASPKLPDRHGRIERRASAVVKDALRFLDGVGPDEPWFLWVHFYDPHQPFEAPSFYASPELGPYEAEIAYADAQLGRLLVEIQRRGQDDDLLVAVTADHGESLGEHGEETHGVFLYDAVMHVPLILAGRSLQGVAGRRIERRVLNSDLAPTLLRLAGLDAGALEGSAVALLGPAAEDRDLYVETLTPFYSYGWRAARGLIWRDHKLIVGAREELYDLDADPDELHDRSDAEPALRAAMRARLDTRLERVTSGAGEGPDLDTRERQRLEALGYVRSETARGDPFAADLPDPAARIGDSRRIVDAEKLLDEVRATPAPAGEEARARHAEWAQAQIRRAREELEAILRVSPHNPEVAGHLAIAYGMEGDLEAAARQFEIAVARPSAAAASHTNLATAWVKLGREEDAVRHIRARVDRDPSQPAYPKWLAEHFATLGQPLRSSWWLEVLRRRWAEDPDLGAQVQRWIAGVEEELRRRGTPPVPASDLPESEPVGR